MLFPKNSSFLLTVLDYVGSAVFSNPAVGRNPDHQINLKQAAGDEIFRLGNITYLTDSAHGVRVRLGSDAAAPTAEASVPLTHIVADAPVLTRHFLEGVINRYTQEDDVFSKDFLGAVYITSFNTTASLDDSAVEYLSFLGTSTLFLDAAFEDYASNISGPFPVTVLSTKSQTPLLPPGPFVAAVGPDGLLLSTVFRLYTDHYRAFVDGVYRTNDGTGNFKALGHFSPEWSLPSIP
jgi:hypothetical protein